MPWTANPIAIGDDWTSLAVINELIAAISERMVATYGGSGWSPRTAGADVQKAFASPGDVNNLGWANLQSALADMVPRYVNHIDYPTMTGVTGTTSVTWSIGSWATAAGIATTGGLAFTAKYPRTITSPTSPGTAGQRAILGVDDSELTDFSEPEGLTVYEHDGATWQVATDQWAGPDVVTTCRTMKPGDYIGSWIFQELYAGVNLLRWTYETGNARSGGGERWLGDDPNSDEIEDWAGSQGNAAGNYSYSDDVTTDGLTSISTGNHSIFNGRDIYRAQFWCVSTSARWHIGSTALAHSFVGWLKAPPTLAFEDNPSFVLTWDTSRLTFAITADAWCEIMSAGAANTTVRTSDPLVSTSLPVQCGKPPDNMSAQTGFRLYSPLCKGYAKWDVPGGFEYLD